MVDMIGNVVIFKTLTDGYYAIAIGKIVQHHGAWVDVEHQRVISSINNVKMCSHRVGVNDIVKAILPKYLKEDNQTIIEDFPEVLI